MNDAELSVINLQLVEAVWKLLLIVVTYPLFARIEVETTICSSGVLENYADAWNEMTSNSTLTRMTIFAGFLFGIATILGVWIIKF